MSILRSVRAGMKMLSRGAKKSSIINSSTIGRRIGTQISRGLSGSSNLLGRGANPLNRFAAKVRRVTDISRSPMARKITGGSSSLGASMNRTRRAAKIGAASVGAAVVGGGAYALSRRKKKYQ